VVSGPCAPTKDTSSIANLTVKGAPEITVEPIDRTLGNGGNTYFQISATYADAYLWEVYNGSSWSTVTNAGVYSGSTTNKLSITAATFSMDGYKYRCTISGSCGANVTSDEAILTVNGAPAITENPKDTVACVGGNLTLRVVATGTISGYQWYENNGLMAGKTNSTLVLNSLTAGMDSNKYFCIVYGSPNATSTEARIRVITAPTISTQPLASAICDGLPASFNVNSNSYGLSYQWQNNASGWSNLSAAPFSGFTTSSLAISTVSSGIAKHYRAKLTNQCGSIFSDSVKLTLRVAPSITTDPSAKTICEASNTSFTSTIAGSAPLSYQWQMFDGLQWNNIANTAPYNGATLGTLSITNTPVNLNGKEYRVKATNTCGNISSNGALLTVDLLPVVTVEPIDISTCQGDTITFDLSAAGKGVITYKWQVNSSGNWTFVSGVGYSGENSASLMIKNVPSTYNNYQYRCIVEADCSPADTSIAVTLNVNTSPIISLQSPATVNVCMTQTKQLYVAANASTFQWQWLNGTWQDLADNATYYGSSDSVLNISNANSGLNGNKYRCVIEGTCPPIVNSSEITLLVDTLPEITSQPTSMTVCAGSDSLFTISAIGSGLSYQWFFNNGVNSTWTALTEGLSYSGTQSKSLAINSITESLNGYKYRCQITGVCSPVLTSSEVVLTVLKPVSILSNTSAENSCLGDSLSLSVSAQGTLPLLYTWKKNSSAIGGATNASYIKGSTVLSDSGNYICEIENACNSLSTPIIVVKINTPPMLSLGADREICFNSAETLDAGIGKSFIWNTGSTNSSIDVSTAGTYSVTIENTAGCVSSDTVVIDVKNPYESQQLCAVTVDKDASKVKAVWNKTMGESIQYYNVYRETNITNVFTKLATLANTVTSYIDSTSFPALKTYRYRLSITDSCGNESSMSSSHRNINLNLMDLGATKRLEWNAAQGFSVLTYRIYRGTTQTNLTPIDSVTSETLVFNDNTAPVGDVFYMVEALKADTCTINSTDYFSSISNIASFKSPVAEFSANNTVIDAGNSVTFSDLSTNTPNSWYWSFEGGTPQTSTNKNPSVLYAKSGIYKVSLIVSNQYGSSEIVKNSYISVKGVYNNEVICMVSIDPETQKNMIVWQRTDSVNTAYYNIYKLEGASYSKIGSLDFNKVSVFVDSSSSPTVKADRYKISAVDIFNFESDYSPYHESMNLSILSGRGTSSVTLLWNKYIDESGLFVPEYYYIYRGTDSTNLQLHDSVSGTLYAGGTVNYNITNTNKNEYFQVAMNNYCAPTILKASSGPFSQSLSNLEDNRLKESESIRQPSAYMPTLAVNPNPVKTEAELSYSLVVNGKVSIDIIDANGKLISRLMDSELIPGDYKMTLLPESLGMANGWYIVRLTQNNLVVTKEFTLVR